MSDQDLKTSLASASTALDFVQRAWAGSEKNTAARQYMAGVLDAMRYAEQLTYEQYDTYYKQYVYGQSE